MAANYEIYQDQKFHTTIFQVALYRKKQGTTNLGEGQCVFGMERRASEKFFFSSSYFVYNDVSVVCQRRKDQQQHWICIIYILINAVEKKP